jgi:hypothetical protein
VFRQLLRYWPDFREPLIALAKSSAWPPGFATAIRGFESKTGRTVKLRFAPDVADDWLPELLLLRCESELAHVTSWFGAPLSGRVGVYVFDNECGLPPIHGRKHGGFALVGDNSVAVTAGASFDEIIRHELAHLFADRWNRFAPPLVSEGLAMCAQRTVRGVPLQFAARTIVASGQPRLLPLLNSAAFYDEMHTSYLAAGSFSDFLLRRYGWFTYQTFYRSLQWHPFCVSFERHFGLTIEAAESQWRDEAIPRAVLARRLGKVVWLCSQDSN